jgi:hypothetical protein
MTSKVGDKTGTHAARHTNTRINIEEILRALGHSVQKADALPERYSILSPSTGYQPVDEATEPMNHSRLLS